MEQVKAGEPAYNEAEAVRLKGKLDVAALERAFNLMVARHEILRTTIEARDGKPITVIHESFPLRFKKISLRHARAQPARRRIGAVAESMNRAFPTGWKRNPPCA